jgi:hypothetical protein
LDGSCARTGGQQPHNPAAIGIHRTRAAEASAARREGLALRRLDRRAWRRLGVAALAWFLVLWTAFNFYNVIVAPLRGDILGNDLTLIYIGARIGLEHGWSSVYTLSLQHELFAQLRPHAVFHTGEWFISPPIYAWLLLPIVFLGPQADTFIWLGLIGMAFVAAWWIAAPRARGAGWLWLLGALAWYPVLYSIGLVQPALILVLIAAAAWRLTEDGKPYLAGAVLGLSAIKPQLTLVLPLILLAAGRWRVAVTCAAVVAAFAVASLIAIGPQGLHDYRSLLSMEQAVPNNRYFTLAYPLGPDAPSYIAAALVVVIAAAGAFLNRRASDARIFALGIVATALSATYWHLQDFTVLLLAAWLFWREQPPVWQRWLLLFVAVTAEFAWPLTPLPLLIGVTVWFACLVAPRRSESSQPATA